jgi:hypothetical protein
MSVSTIARGRWGTAENTPHLYIASPLIRAARVRNDAASVCRRLLTRPAKQFKQFGIAPQTVSELRHTGGPLGTVGVLMIADPSNAQQIAAHIQAVADAITATHLKPLAIELREYHEADTADELLKYDVAVDESPEKLRELEAALLRVIAEAKDAVVAIRQNLEDGSC